MKTSKKAIGYVRVSTRQQVQVGDSLQTQIGRIKEWAASNGYELIGIEQDVGSGRNDAGSRSREGLESLIRTANREKAAIVVTRWDRLSRSVNGIKEIFRRIPRRRLFAVDDGIVGSYGQKRSVIIEKVKAAEAEAEALAGITGSALQRMKDEGVHLGNPGDPRNATFQARKANVMRADERAEEIARILLDDPKRQKLSHRGLADLLNSRGLKTGHGRPFDRHNVRGPRKRALEHIREQQELAAEVDTGPFAHGVITTDDFVAGLKQPPTVLVPASPKPNDISGEGADRQNHEQDDDYKDVPLYGIF